MRKKTLKLVSVAILAAMSIVFSSCSKDKEQNDVLSNNKNYTIGNSDVYFEINTNCNNVYERYQFITPVDEESYWTWKRYENEEFIFDLDFNWVLPTVSSIEIINYNSIKVFYTNGMNVQVENISSDGNFTTSTIIADNDSIMTVDITFPFDLDFMAAASYFAINGLDGNPDMPFESAVPWSVIGGTITQVVSVYWDLSIENPTQLARFHAEQCSQNNSCILSRTGCSVQCSNRIDDPANPNYYNCSQHNYICP